MKIPVRTICNWLTELDINCTRKIVLWIDVCQIPPKDDNYNIFFACEPSNIAPFVSHWLSHNWQHFNLVLGYEPCTMKFPNSDFCIWRRIWVPEYETIKEKEYNVSFICGSNNRCIEHQMRQDCWNRQEEISIPRKFFYSTINLGLKLFDGNLPCPRDTKIPAFNSMFHIAMENCIIPNCFTEKVMDCFATKTVPIYFGCPNIGEFFDIRGIIIANSVDEIVKICNNLTEQDYWDRMEYMEINKKLVLEKYSHDFNSSFNAHLKPIIEKYSL